MPPSLAPRPWHGNCNVSLMKKVFVLGALAVAGAFILGCSGPSVDVEAELAKMSVREKVGQLFCLRPEALDTTIHYVSSDELPSFHLQEVNDRMRALAAEYPVGGITLFAHNISDPSQLAGFVADIRALPGAPLLCVDEEGGRVARLANNPAFGLPKYESMAAFRGPRQVYRAARTIGKYLAHYGFDVDFAPVADVNTNPENIVIGNRAFSSDPSDAARKVKAYVRGLRKAGVISCLKHFPGHGDTKADTHFGYAVSEKTWEQMLSCEMIPFKSGIAAGAPMVMSAHISVPAVTGSDVPSTLSPVVLGEKLRGELGFEGVIVTDAMEMGAIAREYAVSDACVLAILAGADMLLCVKDYPAAFDAVLSAVEDGVISAERLDTSVRRILQLKHRGRR